MTFDDDDFSESARVVPFSWKPVIFLVIFVVVIVPVILVADDYREDRICSVYMKEDPMSVRDYFFDKKYNYESTLVSKEDDEFLHLCCDRVTSNCFDITSEVTKSYSAQDLDGVFDVENVLDE